MRIPSLAAVLLVSLAAAPGAAAQTEIPEGPGASALPGLVGGPATPNPLYAPEPPRHPHMAPNGRSNLHVDGYQTDTDQIPGPLGRGTTRRSTFQEAECASVTFDSRGRIVTSCVGLTSVTLILMDPATLQTLASYALPARRAGTDTFQNFTGGGYFYLDDRDRAVVPTAERHILVIGQTAMPAFVLERDVDLTGVVGSQDALISVLPDWTGRIWFARRQGVVGTVDAAGGVRAVATGEPIGNSFAVDSDGSVSIVTDAALYRFEAGADGTPRAVWRETYANVSVRKPGQSQAGSGTTPTLIGSDRVAITDNADPMNVLVYQRGREAKGERMLCRQPVFSPGAGSTDQSLIGTPDLIVVENNYGYTGPAATQNGSTTTPGLARVDLDPSGRGCRLAWTSQEIAPSVVPKLSLANGLVYTYTKDVRSDGEDAWYLTAIDVRTGATAFKALGGEGLGHNNNYAPVTLGPDGTAYVGVLGGLVAIRDAQPPPRARALRPASPRLRLGCARGGRVSARLVRSGYVREVRFSGRSTRTDTRAPFRVRVRARVRTRVRALVTLRDGATLTRRVRARRCR